MGISKSKLLGCYIRFGEKATVGQVSSSYSREQGAETKHQKNIGENNNRSNEMVVLYEKGEHSLMAENQEL